jgi:membrane fusion protein (multidrug efflux system)
MTAIDAPESPEQSSVPPAKKRGLRPVHVVVPVLMAAAAVAAVSYGTNWLLVGRFMETTNDAYLKADAMVVAPRVSGYVFDVPVVANQDVEPGQVLARIEDGPYKAQLARAQAQADSAAAEINRLRAQVAHEKSMLDQARAAGEVAAAVAAYAERDSDRFSQLAKGGAVSRQQVDQARTLFEQRRAELDNAKAVVTTAIRAIDVLEAQIGEGESALEAARASVTTAQLDLDATVLRSRIKGRVGDKTVSIGQFVTAGTRLMSVMPLQDIYLEANYKETQIGRLRVGQPVEIRVDALPDTPVAGRVESLSPGTGAQFALLPPENATGNFTKIVQRVPVRIRIEAEPKIRAALLPGLSVTAIVDTRKTDGEPDGRN